MDFVAELRLPLFKHSKDAKIPHGKELQCQIDKVEDGIALQVGQPDKPGEFSEAALGAVRVLDGHLSNVIEQPSVGRQGGKGAEDLGEAIDCLVLAGNLLENSMDPTTPKNRNQQIG